MMVSLLMLNELTDLEPIELTVVADDSFTGRSRLDQYLASHIEDLSRARVQKLIDDGLVKVNGVIARASLKLKEGDLVEVYFATTRGVRGCCREYPPADNF
jgi:RNA-binding protein YlmH